MFQMFHVFLMMQASKLNTVFQVGSREGKVDEEYLLPYGSFDTAQGTSGVLDCKHTLLLYILKSFSARVFLIHSFPDYIHVWVCPR